jgi:hypothetical protein
VSLDARRITLSVGTRHFTGRLETQAAAASCAWLLRLVPIERDMLQARWSGEAGWVPLGSQAPLPPENATAHPQRGQVLLYAGALSEPELLVPYGACAFASKAGVLAGNHVITLEGETRGLAEIGRDLLWKGAQTLRLALA